MAPNPYDGDILEDHELAFEILLLLLGGDETTRNVTCGGMEQLLLHPDQMRALIAAPAGIPVAVEEMLRWVSPIKNMSRTLTTDIEFGGETLRAGDKALLLYEAANLDEAQFDRPEHFDATRTPNDHIAFGGGHIPDALGIGADGSLSTWAAWVVPYDRPILLVAETPFAVDPAIRALVRVGLDDVRGWLEGGMKGAKC